MRRRGTVPPAPYVLRHGLGGPSLTRTTPAPRRRRLWRGKLGFAAALTVLVVSATLLWTGAHLRPAPPEGPCPERASTAAYAQGHKLLVRAEPALGSTTLVHLCTDRGTGPVSTWSLRVDGGPASAAQAVAHGTALAAAPLPAGRRTTIEVVVTPRTGPALTFTTQVTAR